MKVLHVIDSGGLYGAEVMLLNLIAEQIKLGLEPVIASIGELHITDKPLESEAVRRGIQVEKFRMRPGPNLSGLLKILQFAWRGKFDLFHSHGYKANILLGMMPRSLRKIPVIATLHGWTSTNKFNKIRLYEWVESLSLHFIESVVLVNVAMRDKIKMANLHVVNNGISLIVSIHDGSDKNKQEPLDREIVGFCRGGCTIGAIGRLSKEKGFEHLLEAVESISEKCHDIRLVIIGEGSQRKTLEAKAELLGITDKVLLPGYQDKASRYLPYFDVFALSSVTEGLPMVILEAMQAGLPIVATKVGGVPELLANGDAGVLVESSNPGALSEGIGKILKDPGLGLRLAERAKKLVREKYSSKKMAEEYQTIYRRMLAAPMKI